MRALVSCLPCLHLSRVSVVNSVGNIRVLRKKNGRERRSKRGEIRRSPLAVFPSHLERSRLYSTSRETGYLLHANKWKSRLKPYVRKPLRAARTHHTSSPKTRTASHVRREAYAFRYAKTSKSSERSPPVRRADAPGRKKNNPQVGNFKSTVFLQRHINLSRQAGRRRKAVQKQARSQSQGA